MCPTRPASCLVNIKPGLTNTLINEKKYLQACFPPCLSHLHDFFKPPFLFIDYALDNHRHTEYPG